MSEIDKVVRALVANLGAPPDFGSRNELSPVLSVITVLMSLDKRKPEEIEERIKALQSPDPDYGPLAEIRDYAGLLTPEKYLRIDPRGDGDGKRAALLLPLLDALVDSFRDFPGHSEKERARAWAIAARPSDWSFGPFRLLGLKGFQHLRMLLGANTIIPTKDVVGFVAKAVGRAVDAPEAVYLLERAAGRLRYEISEIPREIWARAFALPSTPR